MRQLLAVLVTVFALGAHAEVIKTCSTTIKLPGNDKTIPTLFMVLKNNGQFSAITVQDNAGHMAQFADVATVSQYAVRPNLTENTIGMNEAEQLIQGTESFLKSPIGQSFKLNIDLNSIRQATVYQIGKATHMGGTVIIEAKDKDGRYLGSFLTGFLPFQCEP